MTDINASRPQRQEVATSDAPPGPFAPGGVWWPAGTLPWCDAPAQALAGVRGVFTDIDDTLTADGAIQPQALQALHALQAAGLPVVAVTGRPMGWSRPFARDWPVQAIVAENGALLLRPDPQARAGHRVRYQQDRATRAHNAQALRALSREILARWPHARLATDSAGRVTDMAIDHAEHAHLPPDDIEAIVAFLHQAGLRATVSSIHINAWFGTHDKWQGACWAHRLLTRRNLSDEVAHWVYVGDSTNDQPMFAQFPLSVGVANLCRFAPALSIWPRYVTTGERGAGFAQVAQALLVARRPACAFGRA